MGKGDELVDLVDWLLDITKSGVSPDAYFNMLQVSKGVISQIFGRGVPHLAEISDLTSGIGIICLRRRASASFGLHFLREALTFHEDDYSLPINTVGAPVADREELLARVDSAWANRFANRYMPPASGSFSDFETYYSHLCASEVVDDVSSMADIVPLNRLLAVFARLVDLACEEFAITPNERENAARLAGSIEDTIRISHEPDVVERFAAAASKSFEIAQLRAPFKDMARRLERGEFSKHRPEL